MTGIIGLGVLPLELTTLLLLAIFVSWELECLRLEADKAGAR